MFDPISWAIGFAATRGVALLEHARDRGLPGKLLAEVRDWAAEVPKELAVGGDAMFDQLMTDPDPASALAALRAELSTSRIPSPDLWCDAFLERWTQMHERSREDELTAFFTAEQAQVEPHLRSLAERVSRICGQDPNLFMTTVMDLLNEILHSLQAETEVAPPGKRFRELLTNLFEDSLLLRNFALSDRGHDGEVLPLVGIYTALDIVETVAVADEQEPDKEGPPEPGTQGFFQERLEARLHIERAALEGSRRAGRRAAYSRRVAALEAAAVAQRLVIIGQPGSGKSTFLRYLALCLAGELLGRTEARLSTLGRVDLGEPPLQSERDPAWDLPALVPLFVELRRFVADAAFPKEGDSGRASHLLEYLAAASASEAARAEWGDIPAFLSEGKGRGAILLLDGLDETAHSEERRIRLRAVIGGFARAYPLCRIILTSRPAAYGSESPWRLDGFGFRDVVLAPFSRDQQALFCKQWYGRAASRISISIEEASTRSDRLVMALQNTSYLQPLAESPLMLTMMADLHAHEGGRLPTGGRGELYRESVRLLLDRWNLTKGLGEGPGQSDDRSLSQQLGMSRDELLRALADVAYQVHKSGGVDESGSASVITREKLSDVLEDHRTSDEKVDMHEVREFLHQRAGILIAEGPKTFRFAHRSFQEYLAACHFYDDEDFPDLFEDEFDADPVLWREVALFAVARADNRHMAWALIDALVSEESPAEVDLDSRDFLRGLYAGLSIVENELHTRVKKKPRRVMLDAVRDWLCSAVERGALAPQDRVAAGDALAVLGDERPGVGLVDRVPDIAWRPVAAGEFRMGEAGGERTIDLPEFKIARYPVTNLQFQAFVDDGGYTESKRDCWTQAGWAWLEHRVRRQALPLEDLPPSLVASNFPRVAVSWHEALAFCRWLGGALGEEVRLPTEEEWEKAARGTDGSEYPWPGEFDREACNTMETGLDRPSTVGAFPKGQSVYDADDMAGNVWEWCSSKYDDSEPNDAAARVLRGGSYIFTARYARCAFRGGGRPDGRDSSVGFRVCSPVPLR